MRSSDTPGLRDNILLYGFAATGLVGPLLLLSLRGYIDVPALQSNRSLLFISLFSFAGVFIMVGLRAKGKMLGVTIDSRNRFSLSRLQISIWTILVLASIVSALSINAFETVGGNLPTLTIDWTLITLLGLATASSLAGPGALATRTAERASLTDEFKVFGKSHLQGKVLINLSPEKAELSDFVTGEEAGNFGTIDLARLQMLLITAVVWIIYLTYLAVKFEASGSAIEEFPVFDTTTLALIGASHAGYISGKLIPHGKADPEVSRLGSLPPNLASLQLKAEILDRELLQTVGARVDPNSPKPGPGAFAEQIEHILSGSMPVPLADSVLPLVGKGDRAEARISTIDEHKPSPELVERVKEALNREFEQLEPPLSEGKNWTVADDEALNVALQQMGFQRANLDRRTIHALEEVLEALEYLKLPATLRQTSS